MKHRKAANELRLSEVPAYLFNEYGIDVCRQTVYNWSRHGKKGIRLETTLVSLIDSPRTTTREKVDEFIRSVGKV